MKLSKIISARVFSLYESCFVGTVYDVALCSKNKKLMGVYVFDEQENEFFVATNNIVGASDNIVIKNQTKMQTYFNSNFNLSPVGKNVVSINGENFGKLTDIEFNEKFEIANFETSTNNTLPASDVAWISSSVVVGNKKHCNFKPKSAAVQSAKVHILGEEKIVQLMPEKLTVNAQSLIGKTSGKDLIGTSGEVIVKNNQTISQKHIMVAKKQGKINQLFYSVK